eukprot:maker-scaffold60_size442463-snap-gene-2.12 protein:Tk12075 transcript:maker-scaffold60_size442463-snap-gene-2.12-mRNA-1 annotation:"conserved hypothetical protein"
MMWARTRQILRHARISLPRVPPIQSAPGTRLKSDLPEQDEEVKATRKYINENPELQKLLAEIYQGYESNQSGDRLEEQVQSISHEEFQDEDAEIIYDVDEERLIREKTGLNLVEQKKTDVSKKFKAYSLERAGKHVFSIEEVVQALRNEKCQDICVISIPPEIQYGEYMLIGTCRSTQHLRGVASFIKKLYKLKKNPGEDVPKIEGLKTSKDWMAVDFGNVVLNLFTLEAREKYDLESLWALGPEFDKITTEGESKSLDAFISLKDMIKDFEPLDTKS